MTRHILGALVLRKNIVGYDVQSLFLILLTNPHPTNIPNRFVPIKRKKIKM